jgi:3-methylfumaryl-CoA hydratase
VTVELTLADLGLPEESVAVIDAAHVARIAATLDAPLPEPGDPLPTMWHWAFFTPTTATAGLGLDGHPRLGSAALAAYPRRMFGAGQTAWEDDLVVGEPARRTSAVRSARQVSGGSGDLLIVGLEHRYHRGETRCLTEQQSIVYRRASSDRVPLPVDAAPPEAPPGGWVLERRPEPPLLFRFSAITFNTHRIHYDRPYAGEVEGYPGLVVHGPLTAITLTSFAERCTGGRLATFDFKATAPLFAGQRSTALCTPDGDLRMVRNDGTVAMQATFTLRPAT